MGLRSLFTWLAAPPETKYRMTQQNLDLQAAKKTARVLSTPGLSVTSRKAVDGKEPGPPSRIKASANGSYSPPKGAGFTYPNGRSELRSWYLSAEIVWDGKALTATGNFGRPRTWEPAPKGLRPGTDAAEIFRHGSRPMTSGECPTQIAAIATVGLSGYELNRVVFLDEDARELSRFSMVGFTEDDMMRIAAAAGIAYRSYILAIGGYSTMKLGLSDFCEALFPHNAAHSLLLSYDLQESGWWRRPIKRS
ncbi:hypothetical protein [Catenulispora pinisilvae]|uniref:hypothetical protein n=1 Tax=Catenulispora pinisilvae TaxID=2705253 RepID=UPI001891C626|nr:hypothetical protein [Catenulispora pinisilvae]